MKKGRAEWLRCAGGGWRENYTETSRRKGPASSGLEVRNVALVREWKSMRKNGLMEDSAAACGK